MKEILKLMKRQEENPWLINFQLATEQCGGWVTDSLHGQNSCITFNSSKTSLLIDYC